MSGLIAQVREMVAFTASIENGELAQYWLLLDELRDGRGYVFLMELPWDGHETERLFDDLAEACEAADTPYQLGQSAGVWRITTLWLATPHSDRTSRLCGDLAHGAPALTLVAPALKTGFVSSSEHIPISQRLIELAPGVRSHGLLGRGLGCCPVDLMASATSSRA